MQILFSKHQFSCIFLFATLLLQLIVPATASRLYELDLLRQDPTFQINPRWFSDDVIKDAKTKIKNDSRNKSLLLFEIASATAQQGKLLEALEQMALIDDPKLKEGSDFLEERAEIKSLLGFDSSAIEDMNKIERRHQNYKVLWHLSLILKRAGKTEQSNMELRKAVAEAERFKGGDNYHRILLESAKRKAITALEPDAKKADQVLAMINSILVLPSAPSLSEATRILGLNEKSAENQVASGVTFFSPMSEDSPIKRVSLTPDAHQITVEIDNAACGIPEDVIRKQFDAATEQELYPGAMSGCGPGTLALVSRESKAGVSQFIFDAGNPPVLRSFFISFKRKQ
jgi:hypothetical protein